MLGRDSAGCGQRRREFGLLSVSIGAVPVASLSLRRAMFDPQDFPVQLTRCCDHRARSRTRVPPVEVFLKTKCGPSASATIAPTLSARHGACVRSRTPTARAGAASTWTPCGGSFTPRSVGDGVPTACQAGAPCLPGSRVRAAGAVVSLRLTPSGM